jgi:hypothetical protein
VLSALMVGLRKRSGQLMIMWREHSCPRFVYFTTFTPFQNATYPLI